MKLFTSKKLHFFDKKNLQYYNNSFITPKRMVLKIWWNSVRKANSERAYYLLRTRDTGDIANSAIPQIFKMNMMLQGHVKDDNLKRVFEPKRDGETK